MMNDERGMMNRGGASEVVDPREIVAGQCGHKEAWLRDIEVWERWPNEALQREYFVMMREELCGHFCYNAGIARRVIGAILIVRGITSIPGLFGGIEVRSE